MVQKKLLKKFFLISGLSAALVPIAIAASCGSESSPTPIKQTKVASTDFIRKIKASPSSTHRSVTWAVETDPTIAEVRYLYKTTPQDLEYIKTVDVENWSDTLPSKVSLEVENRYLWAKLMPASGYELADRIIDITASSEINLVKTDLNIEGDYSYFNVVVQINIELLNPYTVVEGMPAPSKAAIVYDLPNKEGASLSELQAFLASKPQFAILNTIKAYLKPIDETKYLLTIKKAAVVVNLAPASTSFISNIKAKPTSTHDAVTWDEAKDPTIAKVQYFYSAVAKTIDEVKKLNEASWMVKLPTAIDFEAANRKLWAKLTPADGYKLTDDIIDITETSQIGIVKSRIDASAEFASYNLKVQANISAPNNYSVEVVFGLFPKTELVCDLPSKTGATFSELQAFVATNPTDEVLNTVKVYLKASDETKYALTNNKKAALVINRATSTVALTGDEKAELAKITVADSTSTVRPTHNAMVWKALPTLPERISNILFLSGNYATETDVKNAPIEAWKSNLPESVDYRPSKRHLWARVTGAIGYVFENPYVDLTTSSKIINVTVLIDAIDPVNFNKIDLSKIVITGTWSAMRLSIPESAGFTLPPYLALAVSSGKIYSVTNPDLDGWGGYIFPTDVQNHFDNNNFIVTDESIKNIKFYLSYVSKAIDPDFTSYIDAKINNNKLAKPQFEIKTLEAQKLMQYYKASGTASAITWNNLPLPYGFDSVKFITGNYATKGEAIASGVESSALPTTLDANPALRHLWVKVTPKVGFTIDNGESYIDLTASSGIQSLA